MSLRLRLIASIVFVLLVSLCVGGLAAGWHAVRSVRTEMQAALAVGAQTLRNGIDDLPEAGDPRRRTRTAGAYVRWRSSRPCRAAGCRRRVAGDLDAAERWRRRCRHGSSPSRAVARARPPRWRAQAASSRSKPIPATRSREVWTQLQDDLVAVGLSCGLSILLVSLVVGRALRPLDRLSAALASFGSGEFAVRVEHAGPPELARLAQGSTPWPSGWTRHRRATFGSPNNC